MATLVRNMGFYKCYVADTRAELDLAADVVEFCLGYTKDTHRLYFWDGSEWRQIRY